MLERCSLRRTCRAYPDLRQDIVRPGVGSSLQVRQRLTFVLQNSEVYGISATFHAKLLAQVLSHRITSASISAAACYAILTCSNLHLLVLGGTTCLQAPKLKMCRGRGHSWFTCAWPYSVSRFH